MPLAEKMALSMLAVSLAAAAATPDMRVVFENGSPAPGLPSGFTYNFGIPALQVTPKGNLLAFCQANLVGGTDHWAEEDGRSGDGHGAWTDIALRRSTDDGQTWGPIQAICRNSTLGKDGKRDKALEDTCQQPAPVADNVTGKVIFLSSPDNWFQRAIESADDGLTWTPWSQATDLDSTLRKPGWGLVFNGLPGGVQLTAPNPHAGRLIVCSSAYWSGGEKEPGYTGKITKSGDIASRYSFAMISDDHGATWRIGSAQVQPYHTTECSISQSYDGDGALYLYTRIWAHRKGEPRRGIAKSTDGGETWDAATLRGLGDTAPDCEGSMISAKVGGKTCFFVSSPWSASRQNLTVQSSCGASAPSTWSAPTVVDPAASSYSSLVYTPSGKLLDLFMCSGGKNKEGICIKEVPLAGLA